MPITVYPRSSDTVFLSRYRTSVFIKPSWWSSGWSWNPFIEVLNLDEMLDDNVDTCELLWRVGRRIQPEFGIGWDNYYPINIQNWYCLIVVHTQWGDMDIWAGIIKTEGDDLRLDMGGKQYFKAYGLESLLDRRKVIGAFVENTSTYIHTTPVFNEKGPRGQATFGNRMTNPIVTDGDWRLYNFGSDAAEWTNLDILRYLLYYFQPRDVPFVVVGAYDVLDSIVLEHDFRGMGLRECISQLIPENRGLHWRLVPLTVAPSSVQIGFPVTNVSNPGFVEGMGLPSSPPVTTPGLSLPAVGAPGILAMGIEVLTANAWDISNELVTLPANPYQIWLNFLGASDVEDIHMETSGLENYDTLIVESHEPMKVTATWGILSSSLEEGWDSDLKIDYDADDDTGRKSDLYETVYTYFRVPKDFPWVGMSPGCFPDGTVDLAGLAPYSYWNFGRAFMRILPFPKYGWQSTEIGYREPFGIIYYESDAKWYFLHDLPDALNRENIALKVGDRDLGVFVKGDVNHIIGLNHFSGTSQKAAVLDYTTMYLTLQIPTNMHMRVIYDLSGFGITGEAGETLYVSVPNVDFWAVGPNTVADIVDGAAVLWNSGAVDVLRDDSAKVRAIASLTFANYLQQVVNLRYTVKRLLPFSPPGSIIRYASGIPVGTIVTHRKWQFKKGRVSIATGTSGIDPREWAKNDEAA